MSEIKAKTNPLVYLTLAGFVGGLPTARALSANPSLFVETRQNAAFISGIRNALFAITPIAGDNIGLIFERVSDIIKRIKSDCTELDIRFGIMWKTEVPPEMSNKLFLYLQIKAY